MLGREAAARRPFKGAFGDRVTARARFALKRAEADNSGAALHHAICSQSPRRNYLSGRDLSDLSLWFVHRSLTCQPIEAHATLSKIVGNEDVDIAGLIGGWEQRLG